MTSSASKPYSILIINEQLDPINYRQTLKQHGINVFSFIEASSCAQGLNLWEAFRPHLILLDSPEWSIFIEQSKLYSNNSYLPIITIVEASEVDRAIKVKEEGVLNYVVKQGNVVKELANCVHEALRLIKLQDQLRHGDYTQTPVNTWIKRYMSLRDSYGFITGFQVESIHQPTSLSTWQRQLDVIATYFEKKLFSEYCNVVETGEPLTREITLNNSYPSTCEVTCTKSNDGLVAVWRALEKTPNGMLELVTAHTRDAMVVTKAYPLQDPGPEIIYINDAFTHLTGYQQDDVLGVSPRLLQGEKTDPAAKFEIRTALQHQKPLTIELINYHKNGSEYWAELSLSPVFSPDGTCTHFVALQRDITTRKQAELQQTQQLALTQAALEEAEAVNKAKDDFLTIVSHDLRSPLTSILASIQLLRTDSITQNQKNHLLSIIERNSHNQSKLLEDLLDYSRIAQSQLPINKEWIQLAEELQTIVQTLKLQAHQKGIKLELVMSDDIKRLKILVDPARLWQVMDNLLSNAIKFTPAQGFIKVNAHCNQGYVIMAVQDTGRGIASKHLPHIFEPFYQSKHQKTKSKGIGLGLSIVNQIVQLHGGTIAVESPGVGYGATFTVKLPLTNY